jgi:glycosyltransferase involved in cell wall biosynthesis
MSVSIIIPTYNRLWCLPRAISSCRGARCKTEIIVVDDGSTDGTWEWLSQQRDLIAVRQENQGQTYAINNGFSRASCEYVRFLDSDDYLSAGTIDLQYSQARDTSADLVIGRVDLKEEQTGLVTSFPDPKDWDDLIAVMLGEGYGSHFLGMLFRRSFLSDIPRRPNFALREDRFFLLEVALKNPSFSFTSGCAGYWIKHKAQMHTGYGSLTTTVAAWQMWSLYKATLDRLERESRLTPRRALAASNVLWPTAHEIAKTHLYDAIAIVKYIKRICPDYQPKVPALLRFLYRCLGFRWTEVLLRMRRALKKFLLFKWIR